MLTVAHAVEECGEGREVLSAGAEEQQVVVDTLQLIHDGADVVDAVAELNTHGLFDDANKRVAVGHGAEVVESVSQRERLRIGHILHHLLDAAVNITEVRIDALDILTVNDGLQTQHTVH